MGLETELGKLVEEQPAGPGVKCLLYKSANNPTVAVHGSILAEPPQNRRGSQDSPNLRHAFSSEEPANSEQSRSLTCLNPWGQQFLSEIPRIVSSSRHE